MKKLLLLLFTISLIQCQSVKNLKLPQKAIIYENKTPKITNDHSLNDFIKNSTKKHTSDYLFISVSYEQSDEPYSDYDYLTKLNLEKTKDIEKSPYFESYLCISVITHNQ